MTESTLMDFEDRLLLLTPELIKQKIEEHRRQMVLWQSILEGLERMNKPIESISEKKVEKPLLRLTRQNGKLPLTTSGLLIRETLTISGPLGVKQICYQTQLSRQTVHNNLKNTTYFEKLEDGRYSNKEPNNDPAIHQIGPTPVAPAV